MWYSRDRDTLKVFVYVQPGAKSNEIVGVYGGALKIRLHAPPVGGLANHELQKFLSKLFNVPTKNVQLISGNKNRRKTFLILGSCIDPDCIYSDPE